MEVAYHNPQCDSLCRSDSIMLAKIQSYLVVEVKKMRIRLISRRHQETIFYLTFFFSLKSIICYRASLIEISLIPQHLFLTLIIASFSIGLTLNGVVLGLLLLEIDVDDHPQQNNECQSTFRLHQHAVTFQ